MAVRSDSENVIRTLYYYTRTEFPKNSRAYGWPIKFHHCFERVVFDATVGSKWNLVVPPPFTIHASYEQICKAISICRQISTHPELLFLLNQQSLNYRGKLKDIVQTEQLQRNLLVDHLSDPKYRYDSLGKPFAHCREQ